MSMDSLKSSAAGDDGKNFGTAASEQCIDTERQTRVKCKENGFYQDTPEEYRHGGQQHQACLQRLFYVKQQWLMDCIHQERESIDRLILQCRRQWQHIQTHQRH